MRIVLGVPLPANAIDLASFPETLGRSMEKLIAIDMGNNGVLGLMRMW